MNNYLSIPEGSALNAIVEGLEDEMGEAIYQYPFPYIVGLILTRAMDQRVYAIAYEIQGGIELVEQRLH